MISSMVENPSFVNQGATGGFAGLQVNLGNGLGGFIGGAQNPVATLPETISYYGAETVADFDSDGDADLLYGFTGSIFLNSLF